MRRLMTWLRSCFNRLSRPLTTIKRRAAEPAPCWQAKRDAQLLIAGTLQVLLVAQFAMGKRIPTDHVQGITVRQLGASQRLELGSVRPQFQLGGDDLFHTKQYTVYSQGGRMASICENWPFLPLPFTCL